ncbi:MAG: hypothetical protein HY548_05000 [Elusimicrobia bacterium]|nr:hypothetical protein [Elusimicrobiota bacterium]
MTRIVLWASALCLLATISSQAVELSFYVLPGAQVEYEGTGYRQFDEGWELKVKPRRSGTGIRWRRSLAKDLALQAQYWQNDAFYAREDGNAVSATRRQTGQTKLSVQSFVMDVRRPLEGSSVEVVAGLTGVYETFHRKDIVFNSSPEANHAQTDLSAAGAQAGFHAGRQRGKFYWDGEMTIGHLFLTHNSQTTEGGSIHRNGYTYAFRLESGWKVQNFGFGVGYVRQLFQIMTPGGKTFPSGAAASLPINKTDFFSPFISASYQF